MRGDKTDQITFRTKERGLSESNFPEMPRTLDPETLNLAIIGLGYVGLPLAVAFGRKFPTTGFDIQPERIAALRDGYDATREATPQDLAEAADLRFTDEIETIGNANIYIVAVPTPIDTARRPDLVPLKSASRTVGKVLKPGNVVIFESTVYPGCTEEVCIPILEQESGLTCNRDFTVGYSPERMNPGDREHRLEDIVKVTAGSTRETAEFVDSLYREVVPAGTHMVSSIRVAEAAKVIENTQRDLNIALVNELAMLFSRLQIDTTEVLEAAQTKWNFLPFKPGLVGGHCIGVDPYYLTHKAQEIGYHPEVILAGRRTNDGMGHFVATEVLRLMISSGNYRPESRVLVLGLSFKENCPDLRNTGVVDVIRELREYQLDVEVYDPWVDPGEAKSQHDIDLIDEPATGRYDAIVLAVAHREFTRQGAAGIRELGRPGAALYDLKSVFPQNTVDQRL